MTISNESLVPGQPVQFTITGFPEETAVKAAIERFYAKAAHADRKFLITNSFGNLIIFGRVDENGQIFEYTSQKPEDKPTHV